MFKKLLKGLLIATIFVGSGVAMTSCKDTDEDQFNEFRVENLTLKEKIDLLSQQLDQLKAMQESCCDAIKADLKVLQDRLKAAEQELADLKAKGATKEELAAAEARLKQYIAEALNNYVTHQELADQLAQTISAIQAAQKAVDEAQDLRLDSQDARIKVLEDLCLNAGSKLQVLWQWMEDMKNAGLGNPDDIKQIINGLNTDISTLKQQLADLQKKHDADKYDDTALQNRIKALEDLLADYSTFKTTMLNMQTTWSNFLANFNQYGGWTNFFNQFNKMNSDLTNLQYYITHKNEIVKLLEGSQNIVYKSELQNLGSQLNGRIDSLNNVLNDQLKNLPQIAELEKKYDALNQLIDQVNKNNQASITELGKQLQDVRELAQSNKESLEAVNNVLTYLDSKVQELTGRVDRINNRLNRLITGIVIQKMVSPALGIGVNDPFGLECNVLLAFYGNNEANSHEFPAFGSSAGSYNDELVLTSDDRARLIASGVKINPYVDNDQAEGVMKLVYNQALIDNNPCNAGRVYVTVNPSNVDFTGAKWDLSTSIGNVSAIQLGQLRHSTKELMHGVSRGTNGFYEADAYLAPGDCGKANIDVEPGLKSSVKEIVRDHSKAAVLSLAKALVHQVNNKIPAYALRATFDQDGQVAEVVSNYSIAAACVRPLSFKTGFGLSFENKMPEIGHHYFVFDVWNYIDRDRVNVHMTFPGINGNNIPINVGLNDIHFTYNENMKFKIEVVVEVDGVEKTYYGYPTQESMEKFLEEFADEFNNNLAGWNQQLEDQVREAINNAIAEINRQVQEIIDEKCAKANDKIDQFAQELNDRINDKLSPWVDRFNEIVDKYDVLRERMGKIFNNPNHMLQPMMFTRTGRYVEVLSNMREDATPVVISDEGDAVTFFATTYNAEIFVPTYRKYIAVTNVFRSDDPSISADNDAICRGLLKEADTNGNFNRIIKGRNNRVHLKVSRPGYTYEIAYTALDYRGAISTVKYYVATINDNE